MVPKEVFPYVANTIKQINIVIKSLIPEINIEIYNAFDKLLKEGKDGVQFEIIAMRGENRIPLLYESAGIKKLISICSNLVACYNRENTRLSYLRTIKLGGQKEKLYNETNIYEMELAMRRAGRIRAND